MTVLSPTYTAAQVAESLAVSEWFVREQVKRGVVTPMRVGDRANAPMRFDAVDVQKLRDAMRPPDPTPLRRRRRRRT